MKPLRNKLKTNSIKSLYQKDFYGFIGILFWIIFFVHSIIFYKECIAYQDYSWEVKYFLNKEGFNLVYFRWGSLPWRFFLIIGPYIHLSLKSILLLTSVWFVVIKFIGWYICHYKFKNQFAGFLVIATILFSLGKGYYAHGWQAHNALFYFSMLFVVLMDSENKVIKNKLYKIIIIVILLILIKATYSVILLHCPLLIFISIDKRVNKIIFSFIFLIFLLITTIYMNPPYEENILYSMLQNLPNYHSSNINGIFFYFLSEVINLNYLIPIAIFFVTIYLLISKKHFWNAVLFSLNVILLFLIIVIKLSTYKSNYPISQNLDYYLQGAFFLLWMLILSNSFFWFNRFLKDKLNSTFYKSIFVLIIIFYSSSIFSEGIKHYEYNTYIQNLSNTLKKTFNASIFIIDENDLPYKFSKHNMNIEFETLIKNNLILNKSIVLFVTAHTKPYTINHEFPVFINSISSLEASKEIDLTNYKDLAYNLNNSKHIKLKHYKFFNPTNYFKNYNFEYFKFENYSYKVVDKDFMIKFNKNYGFSISDYDY